MRRGVYCRGLAAALRRGMPTPVYDLRLTAIALAVRSYTVT